MEEIEPTDIVASLIGRPLTRTEMALVRMTVQLVSGRNLLRACDQAAMQAEADALGEVTR
jgi:hypothetical protein